eukprot:GHVU01011244.1.p1 GENE.GHVU01011244.1~~GHVU01011244.1.p1  ORF type:complete len:312 (+),score=25.64 GHVU01011244.1:391-1326(+)
MVHASDGGHSITPSRNLSVSKENLARILKSPRESLSSRAPSRGVGAAGVDAPAADATINADQELGMTGWLLSGCQGCSEGVSTSRGGRGRQRRTQAAASRTLAAEAPVPRPHPAPETGGAAEGEYGDERRTLPDWRRVGRMFPTSAGARPMMAGGRGAQREAPEEAQEPQSATTQTAEQRGAGQSPEGGAAANTTRADTNGEGRGHRRDSRPPRDPLANEDKAYKRVRLQMTAGIVVTPFIPAATAANPTCLVSTNRGSAGRRMFVSPTAWLSAAFAHSVDVRAELILTLPSTQQRERQAAKGVAPQRWQQ